MQTNGSPSSDLMTPNEAAEYLRITALALAKKRWSGASDLPFLRLNQKTIRYRRSDLDAWLAGCVVSIPASAQHAPAAA